MDRYLYIMYTLLLDKRILAQIGAYHLFYCTFYIHITYEPIKFLAPLPRINKSLVLRKKHYQVFSAVAEEIVVLYANVNTKCFFGTSNVFFIIIISILCAFDFFILFAFFFLKKKLMFKPHWILSLSVQLN